MSGFRFIGPRPNKWIRYRKLKRNFINNLMPEPRMNLVYFSYQRGASDLEDEEYLTKHVGPLNVAKKGLPKEMLGSRILLLDSPGTSLLEGMAENVPTVCYWEPDTFPFCKQAEPYFARLAEVGMLHYSPQAAASWVNKHWNNASGWWQTSDVQDARLAWKDQFARNSQFWWFQWIKVLKKL